MYQLILFTALYPLINFLRKHKKWFYGCYLCSPAIAIGVVLCLIVIVKKLCPKLLFMLNGFRTI